MEVNIYVVLMLLFIGTTGVIMLMIGIRYSDKTHSSSSKKLKKNRKTKRSWDDENF